MSGTTPIHGLRYPTGSDAASGLASYYFNLASDVDGSLSISSTSTPTPKTGLIWYNASTGLTQIYNGSSWVTIAGAPTPIFTGTSSVLQSIGNSAFTDVTLDTNVVDTAGGHSLVTNTNRYTCQLAGYYMLYGKATFAPNATGRRLAHFALNGTLITVTETESANAGGAGNTSVSPVPYLQFLNVGDYVTLQVFQSSGGALNTSAGGTLLQCVFTHL